MSLFHKIQEQSMGGSMIGVEFRRIREPIKLVHPNVQRASASTLQRTSSMLRNRFARQQNYDVVKVIPRERESHRSADMLEVSSFIAQEPLKAGPSYGYLVQVVTIVPFELHI